MSTVTVPALPAVTNTNRADILLIVVAGVDSHVALSDLLNFNTGEGAGFKVNGAGLVGFTTGGSARLQAIAGQDSAVVGPGASNVTVTSAGAVQAKADTGQTVNISVNGLSALIQISSTGHVKILTGDGQSAEVDYVAGMGTDWSGTPPAKMNLAIDRIAARVNLGGTGPIP